MYTANYYRVQKNRPQKGKKSSNGQQAPTKVNDKNCSIIY
jgi:hypothetical protein